MSQQSSPLQGLTKLHIRLFQNVPAHELRITIPTLLTLVRILLVPCIIVSMFVHAWGWAFTFFFVASCTDFLDGALARYLHQKTFLGACLDPIADKLLLVSFFLSLVFLQTPLFQLPLWFVILLLMKEMILVCGALYILLSGRHLDVQPTLLGKSTTLVQMVFIIWLFACYYFHWMPLKTYYCMLTLMVVMTILSCAQYARMGFKQLGVLGVLSLMLPPLEVAGSTFIIERPQQHARSIRSLKREYGRLFAQQLRMSATILKEVGALQSLLMRIDIKLDVVHYEQRISNALVALDNQLMHIRMLRDMSINVQRPIIMAGTQLQQQCAYIVEYLAMIQELLIQYIEQLVEGDGDFFCKKQHALLEAQVVHHHTDLHAMQSLLELLQQLQKECKVVQKNIPSKP